MDIQRNNFTMGPKSNILNIYWADVSNNNDWSILYPEPDNLYKTLLNKKESDYGTFFSCPSVLNIFQKTYVIRSPQSSHYRISNNEVDYVLTNNIGVILREQKSMINHHLIQLKYPWIFFAEESVEMKVTAPYIQYAPHLRYGATMAGKFDIGKWFRQLNIEFLLWENNNEFIMQEDEPIAYIEFLTDKKINLVRFNMTNRLHEICTTNASSSVWEKRVPLAKRYNRFLKSGLREIVLKEIKENIVNV